MNQTLVVDQAFDVSITTSYFLSIRAASDGLSFCILDPVTNTYIVFANYPYDKPDTNWSQTEELILTHEYFKMPYKKVFFMTETSNYTLIPTSLFESDKIDELYQLTHQTSLSTNKILSHKVRMADAHNLYETPAFLYHLVKNQFSTVQFHHQLSPFLEGCLISDQNTNNKTTIHIALHPHFFDIVIIESRHLKLCNSFKINNEKDFVYFVLFAFEQLKLSSDQTKVNVYGIVDRQNSYYVSLKKYLRQTQLVQTNTHFKYSTALKNVETEKHHNLFNLPICV